MSSIFSVIHWNVSPEIFTIGSFSVRWYGLLFAASFLVGQKILAHIFKLEGRDEAEVDKINLYMIAAVVLGARLGHCLFYQPEYYLKNPLEILKIWEGGLASHGAAAGVLIAFFIYSKLNNIPGYVWLLDRVVITVASAAFFIRMGNLMNSEIEGIPTDVPWAFVFEKIDMLPRHPAQLYEALSSLLLFGFLFWVYLQKKGETPQGRILGIFLIVQFGLRFFYETLKENQVAFENDMTMNMGQILSIPLVIIGILLLAWSFTDSSRVGGEKTL